MGRYINPFTDFGFKKLFGEESSKETLIAFLNELLRPDGQTITGLVYLNTEQLGSESEDRRAFFDLYCTTSDGRHIIVEIQRQPHRNFRERLVYYATWPIRRQAGKGGWQFELAAVYVIALLDFLLDPSPSGQVVSRIRLLETSTGEVFYDKLTFICIEMPRFSKPEAALETAFDKWLFLLSRLERLDRVPSRVKERIFMKFLEEAELARLSPEERDRYEYSLKVYRDNNLVLNSALERGYEKGLAEGLLEGKVEGQKEARKELAANLAAMGLDAAFIARATGLPEHEVRGMRS